MMILSYVLIVAGTILIISSRYEDYVVYMINTSRVNARARLLEAENRKRELDGRFNQSENEVKHGQPE